MLAWITDLNLYFGVVPINSFLQLGLVIDILTCVWLDYLKIRHSTKWFGHIATHQVINGHRLSNFGQISLENGSTLIQDIPEDLFQLVVVGDEQWVNLTTGIVQVLADVDVTKRYFFIWSLTLGQNKPEYLSLVSFFTTVIFARKAVAYESEAILGG